VGSRSIESIVVPVSRVIPWSCIVGTTTAASFQVSSGMFSGSGIHVSASLAVSLVAGSWKLAAGSVFSTLFVTDYTREG